MSIRKCHIYQFIITPNCSMHRNELKESEWVNTSIFRWDGKEDYRQFPEHGDGHVVFEPSQEWGDLHYDQYNALDFPNGTLEHLALYIEEKTGISKNQAKGGLIIGGLITASLIWDFLESKK